MSRRVVGPALIFSAHRWSYRRCHPSYRDWVPGLMATIDRGSGEIGGCILDRGLSAAARAFFDDASAQL
jgi:hypothetical protein